jgi:hypothetical protein
MCMASDDRKNQRRNRTLVELMVMNSINAIYYSLCIKLRLLEIAGSTLVGS